MRDNGLREMTTPGLSALQTPRHQVVSLLCCFAAWKCLLLAIALLCPGPGYDASTQLLYSASDHGTVSWTERLVRKLVRWDAVYFTQIAQYGYRYEQEWAFGWSHTRFLSVLASSTRSYVTPSTSQVALAGVVSSHVCHLASVLILRRLSLVVFRHYENAPRFATLVASLHIINPAGLFLSAPYAEAPFSLLTFLGLYAYVESRSYDIRRRHVRCMFLRLGAAIFFGLATTFRGNGLLNGLVFVYDVVALSASLCKDIFTSGYINVHTVLSMITTVISGLLMGIIAAYPQYLAYGEYCTGDNYADLRPWCSDLVPNIYGWVQREYWGTGFLSYWTISNAPLFLLAGPMLVLLSLVDPRTIFASNLARQEVQFLEKAAPDDSQSSGGMHQVLTMALLRRLALPQIALAILALTTYHVQIITRLSSAYPVWYWFLATCITQRRQMRILGCQLDVSRWIISWMVLYSLIQGVLFTSFLPPA